MWSALENMALRESLPKSLQAGDTVHDILVANQINRGRHNLHHLGRRRSRPFILKQFFSLNIDAFLRWQNEARFTALPQTEVCTWPVEEWRGGTIAPFAGGRPLEFWLDQDEVAMDDRLSVAYGLALAVASLHKAGITHRNLTPSTIHINESGVLITDFGTAQYDQWDDFWTDSILTPEDIGCASPEFLCGEIHRCAEDVHAFGVLLHLILSGSTPFGTIRKLFRPLLPGHVPPSALPTETGIPGQLRALTEACLSPTSTDRPTMDEAILALAPFSTTPLQLLPEILPPIDEATPTERNRVMCFITDHSGSLAVFDEALRIAKDAPSIFLFVGLIPGNLPSGHAERYRGKLFRKMGQGLMRCREANLSWSLRMMESMVPEKTGLELARQYRPDTAFLVGSRKEKNSFQRKEFIENLAALGIKAASIR